MQRQIVAGFFEWDAAKLSLRIREMDDEHKVLIALMNKLHELYHQKAGATALIQPGGSLNDQAVIDAANERGVAMVFTGMRHFRH